MRDAQRFGDQVHRHPSVVAVKNALLFRGAQRLSGMVDPAVDVHTGSWNDNLKFWNLLFCCGVCRVV